MVPWNSGKEAADVPDGRLKLQLLKWLAVAVALIVVGPSLPTMVDKVTSCRPTWQGN